MAADIWANGYLMKPIDQEMLANTVRNTLNETKGLS
jgi:DNA-binding NarL/FixJ family response regulator